MDSVPINRRCSIYFLILIHFQFLSTIKCLILSKSVFLDVRLFFLIIEFKMYRRLHYRTHKYLPSIWSISSFAWRQSFRRTFEWTFSKSSTSFVEYCHIEKRDIFVSTEFFVVLAANVRTMELEFTSDCLTWELDTAFSFESLTTDFIIPVKYKLEFFTESIPEL